MEHFRRLGFAHKVRQQGLPSDHPTDIAYLTRFAGRELARLRLPTAAAATQLVKTTTGSWSAAELPHRVSQKFVELTLLQEAQALPSVELRYGWRMTAFEDLGDQVQARVAPSAATDAGAALSVRAHYLVGADGARRQLSFGWEGETDTKRNFMGGKMFAVYWRAPDFYRLNTNDRASMYVIVGDGTQPPPDTANSYSPSACPGGRPPHAWLDDGRSLYDSLGIEWTLLVLGPQAAIAGRFVTQAEHAGLVLQVVRLPDSALLALYAAPLVLIRPDHIVAWRGADDSAAAAMLTQVLGRDVNPL